MQRNRIETVRNLLLGLDVEYNQETSEDTYSFKHKYSITDVLGMKDNEFEERHKAVFDVYPEYSRTKAE
jgi:hypothetical protein